MPPRQPPVLEIEVGPSDRLDPGRWPMTIAAVAQVAREGLTLPPGVTFLVGENGSGKSTLVEAVAMAYGLSPEGGSTQGRLTTRASESALSDGLLLRRGIGASRTGFFLRAETMHGWYSFLESTRIPGRHDDETSFHEMSHGESFLRVVRERFAEPGFYCLDEPEAALSFSSTLGLMAALDDLARGGAQVLCATHSPVLASLPGATILEVGEWGLRRAAWDELDLVGHWKAYLQDPGRYLRHLLGD